MSAFSTVAGRIASRIPSSKVALVLTLAILTLAALALAPASGGVRPAQAAASDPARFILNAFLVPALDADVQPLRWVDPRPVAACADGTAVWVDGEPLQAGALVPEAPFVMKWDAKRCRPFGPGGPRFDGKVTLRIHREDWGFSAYVLPDGLDATTNQGMRLRIERGPASLPAVPDIEGGLDPAIGD